MKKLFLTLIAAVISLTASAQFYGGGEVGLWRNYDANETNFSLAPEIGYKLSDKWALGLQFEYAHMYEDGLKANGVAIAPYLRYGFAKLGIVTFFVDGGFGFGTVKVKDYDDSANSWEIGFKPGLKVAVSKRLDFVAHMGFLGYRDSNDTAAGHNIFGDDGVGFKLSSRDLSFGLLCNF